MLSWGGCLIFNKKAINERKRFWTCTMRNCSQNKYGYQTIDYWTYDAEVENMGTGNEIKESCVTLNEPEDLKTPPNSYDSYELYRSISL